MTSINTFKVSKFRKKYSTSHLFSKPSVIGGIGSSFNVCGNYYAFKTFRRSIFADKDALENDWGVVGNDILRAMKEIE